MSIPLAVRGARRACLTLLTQCFLFSNPASYLWNADNTAFRLPDSPHTIPLLSGVNDDHDEQSIHKDHCRHF